MTSFDVVLLGKLLPGADQGKAVAALARATGLAPEKAAALLTSGQPKLAKRGVAQDAGEIMVQKFKSLGIAAALRPMNGAKAATPTAPAPKPTPKPAQAPPPAPAQESAVEHIIELELEPASASETPVKQEALSVPKAPKAGERLDPALAKLMPVNQRAPTVDGVVLEMEAHPETPEAAPESRNVLESVRQADLTPKKPKAPATPEDAARAKREAAMRAKAAKKREAELLEAAAQKAEEERNPYAPPKAGLTRNMASGIWSLDPAEVPVMRGLSWFREAWDIFLAEPVPYLMWTGMLFAVLLLLTTILPIFVKGGSSSGIMLTLIVPYLAGALCARAHLQNTGNETPLAIKGKNPGRPLLMRRLMNAGAFNALYQIVICVPVLLIAGVFTLGNAADFSRILLAALVGAVLSYPLYLAGMFVPSLVALTNEGAIASIKRGIRAGFASKGALLINALCMAFLAMLCFVLTVMLVVMLGDSTIVSGVVGDIFFSILWLIFTLVSYVATYDIFAGDDA